MAPSRRVRHTSVNLQAENTRNGVGSSSSGDKKKGRQRAQNKKLHDFLRRGGQKPRIEILPHLERPIRLWAKEWVTELGILTRKWIPLQCHYWKDVDHKMKQVVFDRIRDSFDVDFSDPHIVESIENHIQIIYRNHRAELHTFYKGLPDNVDKTQHTRVDVLQADWAMLYAFWEADEKFQARSTINTESRECVEVLHRGGSRSYARGLIENADPVTKEPDFVTFYKDIHYNPSKGWTAPCAEENYERMVEMSTQQPEGDSAPMTTEDIRASVLGVRSGYAPGLGYGVVPPKRVPRVTAAATTANRVEMEELRSRAEIAENELNQLRNQHEQLREQQSIQQRQLEYILAQMGGPTDPWYDGFAHGREARN